MNKNFLNIFIGVILIVIFIIFIKNIVPESVKVKNLVRPNPTELEIMKENRFVTYTDKKEISKFSRLIENKIAIKVSEDIQKEVEDKSFISFEYGYKGNSMLVDNKGRIIIYVSKNQIRKKSTLHWIWWKIDNFFGDNKVYLVYLVKEDKAIFNQIKKIKELPESENLGIFIKETQK
ncbi:MAG: hypothetical protein FH753_05845 [Firmicutes bacterium]|nr:hypothetical protein [Bacillota bacterium]